MKILIINGPNLNMLGKRNTKHYGELTLDEINKLIKKTYPNVKFYFYQTNNEARIIWKLQAMKNIDALIINPAAFTHTSIAIRDMLEIIKIPKVEVHLSDINTREDFRKIDYIKDVVDKVIMGKKENSYIEAVKYLLENK
ncbi:type II 3-dehydroquinate dehydratase [Haploplasma axanthum]|uniref:3-dehydroquinate dehydratase n=1 Tax=Haploplasma axanthum TaxID=29552 RepID=A0A449BEF7_HAPAX|nr:type II 3-dehydroquinate dehydratase [Haploplasma axanthum]VEU80690.1 3-dehydroquinate dehydratase [Haploplasma axanthum]